MDTSAAETIVYRHAEHSLRPALLGSPKRFERAKRLFVLLYFALLGSMLLQGAAFELTIGALVITSCSMAPMYLWFKLPVKGIPVWPIFAGSSIWTFAFPLVLEHPALTSYEPINLFYGALAISSFLAIGTASWFVIIRRARLLPVTCYCLPPSKNQRFWFYILAGSIIYNMLLAAGMIHLPYGIAIILRTGVYALSLISLFILGYHYGVKTFGSSMRFLFLCLLLASVYVGSMGLYLMKPISELLVTSIAIALGSKRPPLLVGVVFVLLVAFLHFGKGEMRQKYWHYGSLVKPHQIPSRVIEWYRFSIKNLSDASTTLAEKYEGIIENEEETSLLLRPSLMQMFMLPFTKAGVDTPLLMGASYTPIPILFVPRLLYPNKPPTTFATTKLTVLYRLQTEEQTRTTTIGWGTMAESVANFGLIGLFGLAIFIGSVLAIISRFSMGTPLSSLRSMITLLLIPAFVNGGPTMAVLLTSYFQGVTILLVFGFLLMKRFHLSQSID